MKKISQVYQYSTSRWGKRTTAVVITLALLLATTAAVLAAEFILEPPPVGQASHQVNGAWFNLFNPTGATGTGLFNPFVRVSANLDVVKGYNTDYRPLQFQEDSPWTDSIKLSDIPTVLVSGVLYREFQLDINQTNSNPNLSLDEVQIWLGGSDAATIRGFVPEADPPSTAFGTFPGYTLTQVYNLDANEDNSIRLNASLSAGSGKRDLQLLVPDAFFGNYGAECQYLGTGCTKYVVFFTTFGIGYPNNDGFEEWGVAIYNVVSGYKWHDLSADGLFQAGEPKLAGWTICAQELVQGAPVGNPICTLTDSAGNYTLPLANGTYRIYETCMPNWFQTFPAPTGGVCGSGVYNVTVSNGDLVGDRNFGNAQLVKVTACKVEDKDANPNTAADRVVVPGWDVFLSIAGVRQTPGAKTGADGCYTWNNLQPGLVYDVEEDVPAGWYAWTPTKHDFGLSVSGGNYSYTFINSMKVNVKACKLEDVDKNPATTADRVPVPGWTVQLTKNGVVQDTKTTGADGCYTWTNLDPLAPPDYYDAHEVVPVDWFAWTPTSVNCAPIASGGTCTATFVNSKKVNVKACKLEDVDTNPATSADRVPVPGWTVELTKNGTVQDSKTTGADGCYTWTNLQPLVAPDYYDVHEVVPASWFAWTPSTVNCAPGVNGGACDATFVNSKRVNVKACKLEDVDTNPATTADRVPVPGWTVQLTKNGVVLDTKTTGADGCYTWTNLEPLAPPNYYDAHEVVPVDWFAWTPTSVNCAPIASGGTCTATFVNSKKVNVKACKWEDVDTNPATTADRVPVSGWTVKLTKNGTVLDTKTTGTDGCYTWTNLDPLAPPNYYDAHEVVPDNWFAWTPTSVDCAPIASGGTCTANFVNSKKVNVKACKLEDVDAIPATTADRVPVSGWTVKLTKNGVVQDTKTTGADGCYTWANLDPLAPPNYYDAHEVVPDNWFAWTPTSVDCTPIASGGTCNATFVNSKRVKVTACKLKDMDGLLTTTTDQLVMPGWPVFLSIAGVRQTPGATTGADGCYSWNNLQPGLTYDVEEDILPNWIALTPTKYNFGPSVSGGIYSYTFINYQPLGCTYTQGYWKTHSMYGPAGPYDPTWDLKAGGDAKFLSDAHYVGYTWYSIMWEPPAKGNAYLILAHQYVAAWLNLNNVDPLKKADGTVLGTALADAEYLLSHYMPTYDFKADPDDVRDQFIILAGILGEFNEGYLGVPHCDDE